MLSTVAPTTSVVRDPFARVSRWWQLVAMIVAMMAIANIQYAWTLFTTPLTQNLKASLAAVQVAFAAFVLCETWLVPFEGALADLLGPRALIIGGGILAGIAWIWSGLTTSLTGLYMAYALGGVGAGAVYGACIGQCLKVFPDRRGLCAGAVAGSYGVGTALTIIPIEHVIRTSGYAHAFVMWGFIQGIVTIAAGLFIVRPARGWMPAGWTPEKEAALRARVNSSPVDMHPGQMVRQASFWAIYFMMALMAFTGLVVTAQLKPMAHTYHVDRTIVAFGLGAVVVAILLDRILNGLTRPFWGWVSDHIGRENTMFIAFLLQAITIVLLLRLIAHPIWFIVLSGAAYFSWGEIFSLFPSIVGDLFGKQFATTNYGIVYTAKGLASIFAGPVAAFAKAQAGSWVPVLWAMVACSALDAVLALVLLKPLARRTVRSGLEIAGIRVGQQAVARAVAGGSGS